MKALTKKDYRVLSALVALRALSRVESANVKQLRDKADISETKVRDALNILIDYDFVAFGIADGRTKSYFITQTGLDEIKSISIKTNREES